MIKVAESHIIAVPDKVPAGWRRTSLGEIGEYINGRGFKKSEWSDRGLPIIRIQNLTGTGKEQNYYDGEIDERHVVNPGDLLISWAATLGAYLWAGPRAALNQHIFKVRSFVDKKFHYYLMQHILGDLYRQTHGSGMVHITKSKFDSMPIVVPETEDQQKRIVAEVEKQFSRLDEAVANLKRVKANLKRYKAAVLKAAVEGRLVETEAELARREGRSYETGEQLLQRILETRRSQWKGKGKYKEPAAPDTADLPELPEGWVWASLDQLSDVVRGGSPRPAGDPRYFGGPVPWITVGPLTADESDYLHCVPNGLTLEGKDRSRYIEADNLLLTNSGATLGVPKISLIGGCINDGVAALLGVEYPLKRYLVSFLRTKTMSMRRINQGAAQPNLNTSIIKAMVVSLPPESEQYRIVAEVDRRLTLLRETEAQVDANLQRADRLKQAILAGAFTGTIGKHGWRISVIASRLVSG